MARIEVITSQLFTREESMRIILIVIVAIWLITATESAYAAGAPAAALMGQVSSMEEPRMEGVLVSAKRDGSTLTVTVVTDAEGRYSFPSARLEQGRYAISIRAAGYEADAAKTADITPGKTARLDLKLKRSSDVAAQLTNSEWLMSMPGTDEQKQGFLNCVSCHTVERIVRSHYTGEQMIDVIKRMRTYAQGSTPLRPQVRPGTREPSASQLAQIKKFADYVSTVNLSKSDKWSYALKTLPRPKGKATGVIYTEYALPRPEAMPHDAMLDGKGMVWYSDFGSQYVGMLDPKTGKAVEYAVPVTKPGAPAGGLDIRFDPDENVWLGMMYQGSVVKLDRKTGKFQTWTAPGFTENNEARLAMVDPKHLNLDGKVWVGGDNEYRLDPKTNEWYTVDYSRGLPKDGPPADRLGSYGVISDSKNNFYGTNFGGQYIIRVDAKTLNVTPFPTPTPNSAPRRGHMDPEDRLWFAEYRGNMIGMFDTKTERTREWAVPTPWSNPYDAISDKDGFAWTGGMSNDRVTRLNPKTDEFVEYLLPRTTNIRRVAVDNTTKPPTFWVGNNHGAALVKLEVLE
jgi:virginiamycin B lyase